MVARQQSTSSVSFKGVIDVLVSLIAAAGWYAAYSARTSLIQPLCQQSPESCSAQALNALDRLWLVNYHAGADYWSFGTQYLAGALALLVPAIPGFKWTRIRIELWILVQATIFNGLINECLRLWIQRPRPFVYLDPVAQGGAAAHYTSFYSGHTSFAALAGACAFFASRRMHDSPLAHRLILVLAFVLAALTGALRVMAGRHFITDTLFGALFGVAIAWAVNRLHQSPPQQGLAVR